MNNKVFFIHKTVIAIQIERRRIETLPILVTNFKERVWKLKTGRQKCLGGTIIIERFRVLHL